MTVFIKEIARGSVTDENGFYQINIPRGTYNIRFSFLGMKEVSINARIYGGGRLDIEMAEDFIPIEGAVVTARRTDMLRRFEVGLDKVNMATFRFMPTTLGETDIFKNILLLPGDKDGWRSLTGVQCAEAEQQTRTSYFCMEHLCSTPHISSDSLPLSMPT